MAQRRGPGCARVRTLKACASLVEPPTLAPGAAPTLGCAACFGFSPSMELGLLIFLSFGNNSKQLLCAKHYARGGNAPASGGLVVQ